MKRVAAVAEIAEEAVFEHRHEGTELRCIVYEVARVNRRHPGLGALYEKDRSAGLEVLRYELIPLSECCGARVNCVVDLLDEVLSGYAARV